MGKELLKLGSGTVHVNGRYSSSRAARRNKCKLDSVVADKAEYKEHVLGKMSIDKR